MQSQSTIDFKLLYLFLADQNKRNLGSKKKKERNLGPELWTLKGKTMNATISKWYNPKTILVI